MDKIHVCLLLSANIFMTLLLEPLSWEVASSRFQRSAKARETLLVRVRQKKMIHFVSSNCNGATSWTHLA